MEDQKFRELIAQIAAQYDLNRQTAEKVLREILRILSRKDPGEESS